MFLTPLGQSYKKIRSHLLSRFCKLASFRICKIEIFANRRQHFFGFNIYFTIALYIEHLLWYRVIAVILFNKYNFLWSSSLFYFSMQCSYTNIYSIFYIFCTCLPEKVDWTKSLTKKLDLLIWYPKSFLQLKHMCLFIKTKVSFLIWSFLCK